MLVTWANDYGVIFTDESLDALQHWMAHEQELALEERELAAGRQFHEAIHEAVHTAAEAKGLTARSTSGGTWKPGNPRPFSP